MLTTEFLLTKTSSVPTEIPFAKAETLLVAVALPRRVFKPLPRSALENKSPKAATSRSPVALDVPFKVSSPPSAEKSPASSALLASAVI